MVGGVPSLHSAEHQRGAHGPRTHHTARDTPMNILSAIRNFIASARDEEGATMVEYGLVVAFIALIALIGVTALGNGVNARFNDTATTVAP